MTALLKRYRQFTWIFPVCIPVLWIISQFLVERLPRWPWADMPVLFLKGGDILVHLAGILALSLLAPPLALLTPLPLRIAVDSVIGSHPLPGVLAAWAPGKHLSITAAYVQLGHIVPAVATKRQDGGYLSAQLAF